MEKLYPTRGWVINEPSSGYILSTKISLSRYHIWKTLWTSIVKKNFETKSESQRPPNPTHTHHVHSTVSCCVKKFLRLLTWIQNIFYNFLISMPEQKNQRLLYICVCFCTYTIECGGIFGSLSDGTRFPRNIFKAIWALNERIWIWN